MKDELKQLQVMGNLAEAYAQISSLRMKRTRNSVLQARSFLADLNDLFSDVLAAYRRKVTELLRKKGSKRGGEVTLLAHNGKTVRVFLSANTGLYGDVMKKTFQKFMADVREFNDEITIVGKTGRALYVSNPIKPEYTYFDFPDTKIDREMLAKVTNHLVQYEKIIVYHGKFVNIIRQDAVSDVVSAGNPLESAANDKSRQAEYLFEPSLEDILRFFETEIFASTLEQAVREHQLSKHASRVLAMDRASNNISEALKKLRLKDLQIAHKKKNRKQLNSLSSMLVWH